MKIKKKFSVSFMMLILLVGAGMSGAGLYAEGFNFGVTAQFGAGGLEGSMSGKTTDFQAVPGGRFGIFCGWDSEAVLGFRGEAFWHHNNGAAWTSGGNGNRISFQTVEVPLLLKATFTGWRAVPGKLALLAGPVFNFVPGSINYSCGGFSKSAKLEPRVFVMGLETGMEYEFGGNNGLTAEFRGGFDFESIIKSTAEDTELKRFYFTLGMRFDVGSVLFRK